MATKKRTYPAEFMQETIRLRETSGKGVMEIERELGIAQGRLNKWKRQLIILAGAISWATIFGSMLPQRSAN